MTNDFAYLLGVYLGDGHIAYANSAYQFIVVSEDIDLCKNISDISDAVIGKKGTISKRDNYYKIVICSKDLCNKILFYMCSVLDYETATKEDRKSTLPSFEDIEHQKQFIIGLMDSDGWIREAVNGRYLKYEVGFKNTNPNVHKIKEIMIQLGLICNKTYEVLPENTNDLPAFSWTINTKSFADILHFRINRKQELLLKWKKNLLEKDTKKKDKTITIRYSKEEMNLLQLKSKILNCNPSTIIRKGVHLYWKGGKPDADVLLNFYKNANEEEKDHLVDLLSSYYRFAGFPHSEYTEEQLIKEMEKINNSPNPLIENDYLQQNNIGIGLANHFHPQMLYARYEKMRSPMQSFNNDFYLKDIINRCFELNYKPTPSVIRKMCRTRDGTRSVGNFKPVIARYFYENYCPINGKTLDFCAGYGGRLIGCISSKKNILYHGIDVEPDSAVNNTKIAGFYKNQISPITKDRLFPFHFQFSLGCSEEIVPNLTGEYDLIFTSPPYHNQERYSESEDQSYKRYHEYDEWKEKFLHTIIRSCFNITKKNGYLIINIKNYKDKPIADDLVDFAIKTGYSHIKTYQMKMSNIEYSLTKEKAWHTEPIFVMRK